MFFWNTIASSCSAAAAAAAATKSLQSCPTLCNPTEGSPPGSTVPGILQARTLEWVAISYAIGPLIPELIKKVKVNDT